MCRCYSSYYKIAEMSLMLAIHAIGIINGESIRYSINKKDNKKKKIHAFRHVQLLYFATIDYYHTIMLLSIWLALICCHRCIYFVTFILIPFEVLNMFSDFVAVYVFYWVTTL